MENIKQLMEKIEKYINEVEIAREKIIEDSREVIANCRRGIQLIHRGFDEDAEKFIEEGHRKLKEIHDLASRYVEISKHGAVEAAARELAEAKCVLSFVRKEDLPDPEEMGVSFPSYLLGLCDAVGELRRLSIEAIRNDRINDANHYLNLMEKIYDSIIGFTNPSSILPIKRKQDSIRSMIEKTREEIVIATCEKKVREKVEEFRELVDSISKSKKREDLDLDIDRVW